VGLTRRQVDREVARVPHVLVVGQTALRLDSIPSATVPAPSRGEGCAGHAVCVLEDEAVGGRVHRRAGARESLTVNIAPGTDRGQLQAQRRGRSHEPVDDRDCRAAMHHRHLSLHHHVAQRPAPGWHPVIQVEGLEQEVACGIYDRVRPLVDRQLNPSLAQYQRGVQGGQTQLACSG